MSRSLMQRQFKGSYMKQDPTLNHKSDFRLTIVQKYTYFGVHRLLDDPSKCYKFAVRHKTQKGARLMCMKCKQIKVIGSQLYTCTSSGFTDDPTQGHRQMCQPYPYEETIKQCEILDQVATERLLFEKRAVGEIQPNKNYTYIATNSSFTLNALRFQVIELRQKVTYLYRIPEDMTKCYRFHAKMMVKNSQVTLFCGFCYSISIQKTETGYGIRHAKTYQSDGYTMLEDPMADHHPNCTIDTLSKSMKMHRILDEDAVDSNSLSFPIVRTMKIGSRQLLVNLEADNTKCYRFHFEQLSGKTFCSCCKMAVLSDSSLKAPLYRFSEAGFLDDPMLNHNSACQPFLKSGVLSRYQLLDSLSTEHFLKSLNHNITCVSADQLDLPTAEDLISSSTSEYPLHIIEPKMKCISYVYGIQGNLEKCYKFIAFSGTGIHSMKCADCMPGVEPRETDVFSMKLDPTVGHSPGCEPRNYHDFLKRHRILRNDASTKPIYAHILEQVEKRQRYQGIYILPNDPTKCYRFMYGRFEHEDSIVAWSCRECKFMPQGQKKSNISLKNYRTSRYRSSLDGFVKDPRLNHVCQPLLYSDVMNDFQLVGGRKIAKIYKYGDDGHKDVAVHDDEIQEKAEFEGKKTLKALKVMQPETRISVHKSLRSSKRQSDDLRNMTDDINIDEEDIVSRQETPKDEDINQDCDDISGNESISIPRNHEILATNEDSSSTAFDSISYNNHSAKPISIEKDDIQLESYSAESKPVISKMAIRKQIFSHTFEIPLFSEDEIKLIIKTMKTIYVECKREESSVGLIGGSLVYSLKLPESVDTFTILSVWTAGKLEVTAEMNI